MWSTAVVCEQTLPRYRPLCIPWAVPGSCGNEKEWSSLAGQLGLSHTTLCAWRVTKPAGCHLLLCQTVVQESTKAVSVPQHPKKLLQPPQHLHKEALDFPRHTFMALTPGNIVLAHSLCMGWGFPAKLWAGARYRHHLSLVVPMPGSFCPAVKGGVRNEWLPLKKHSPAWLNLSPCHIPNCSLHAAGWST